MLAFSIFIAVMFPSFATDLVDPEDTFADHPAHAHLETEHRPGLLLAKEGYQAHHPIVIVPGITSTGLEIWEGHRCMRRNFRERLWGSTLMLRKLLLAPPCWVSHMMLNSTTGLDPDGIRVRAASGLGAADVVLDTYSVWAGFIRNAADVGYDERSLHLASYDWRLAFPLLQKRDCYFTKLRMDVERLVQSNGKRAIIVAHSMGVNVWLYFLQWVTRACTRLEHGLEEDICGLSAWCNDGGGKEWGRTRPSWAEAHIENLANIGGPLLGVPKAIPALITGDMWDTAQLPSVLEAVKERFLPAATVGRIFRSMGSCASMMPIGGDRLWGGGDIHNSSHCKTWKEHDQPCPMAVCHHPRIGLEGEAAKNSQELSDTNNMLQLRLSPAVAADAVRRSFPKYIEHMKTIYSWEESAPPGWDGNYNLTEFGCDPWSNASCTVPEALQARPQLWANALAVPLPDAPTTKILCMYGVGRPSERAYHFMTKAETPDKPERLMKSMTEEGEEAALKFGVVSSDGDGTVPLLSLGYLCARGWNHPGRNPSNISVTIREYQQRPDETGETAEIGDNGGISDILGAVEGFTSRLSSAMVWWKEEQPDEDVAAEEKMEAEERRREQCLTKENVMSADSRWESVMEALDTATQAKPSACDNAAPAEPAEGPEWFGSTMWLMVRSMWPERLLEQAKEGSFEMAASLHSMGVDFFRKMGAPCCAL